MNVSPLTSNAWTTVIFVSSVKVFRYQLPHTNTFYSSEPPRYDGTARPLSVGGILLYQFFLTKLFLWLYSVAYGSCNAPNTRCIDLRR